MAEDGVYQEMERLLDRMEPAADGLREDMAMLRTLLGMRRQGSRVASDGVALPPSKDGRGIRPGDTVVASGRECRVLGIGDGCLFVEDEDGLAYVRDSTACVLAGDSEDAIEREVREEFVENEAFAGKVLEWLARQRRILLGGDPGM